MTLRQSQNGTVVNVQGIMVFLQNVMTVQGVTIWCVHIVLNVGLKIWTNPCQRRGSKNNSTTNITTIYPFALYLFFFSLLFFFWKLVFFLIRLFFFLTPFFEHYIHIQQTSIWTCYLFFYYFPYCFLFLCSWRIFFSTSLFLCFFFFFFFFNDSNE